MFNKSYHNRLKADLPAWVRNGWIAQTGADAVLEHTSPASRTGYLPVVFGFLGAVLLAFAAISFVAANWNDIPRVARLALLVASMAAAYGTGYALHRRGHERLADAAVLAGCGVYGAAIMLVGQLYHLPANFAGGLFIWSLGALLAAVVANSRGALGLGLVATVVWSGFSTYDDHGLHLAFLVLWGIALAAIEARDWRAGRHLAVLALAAWIVIGTIALNIYHQWPTAAAFAAGIASFAGLWSLAHIPLAIAARQRSFDALCLVLRPYATAGFLLLLFAWQVNLLNTRAQSGAAWETALPIAAFAAAVAGGLAFSAWRSGKLQLSEVVAIALIAALPMLLTPLVAAPAKTLAVSMPLALLILCASIWVVIYGHNHDDKVSVALGLTSFGAAVIHLYFETFGTLLDTALFFLCGGLLLLALAYVLTRLHAKLARCPTGSKAIEESNP